MSNLLSSEWRIRSPIKVGAAPHRVVAEVLRILLTAKILQGILRGTLISTNIHALQNILCTLIKCLVSKNQPDQRRSHIGPNAGGSLNLSNWKSKLCIALHNAAKMIHWRVYQIRSIPTSQHLSVPFLCHLMCGSLGWVLRARRGTAGSWGRPGGGSQRPPCTRHTHALCTWSYLEYKVSMFGLLMLLKTDWVCRQGRKTITLIMQNRKWTYILA